MYGIRKLVPHADNPVSHCFQLNSPFIVQVPEDGVQDNSGNNILGEKNESRNNRTVGF